MTTHAWVDRHGEDSKGKHRVVFITATFGIFEAPNETRDQAVDRWLSIVRRDLLDEGIYPEKEATID